jgi:hypothetical protein
MKFTRAAPEITPRDGKRHETGQSISHDTRLRINLSDETLVTP